MVEKHEASEHARLVVVQDPRDKVKAGLPESQSPGRETYIHRHGMYGRCYWNRTVSLSPSELFLQWTTASEVVQGDEQDTYVALGRSTRTDTGSPTGREAQGDGVVIVVRGRESRSHGEGPQVSDDQSIEVVAMARAENILVIYSDLSEEWHWKAGRHRKSHIRFGEGVLEKYRCKRQLAGTLLDLAGGEPRPCRPSDLPADRPVEGIAMTGRTLQTTPAGSSVRTCRWIDGDVREPGWRYCGRPTIAGRSWCAEHNAQAHRRS